MRLNISNMRLYIAVYEARNIARVSEKMFLSHQAVSKRIASIESELGASLFTRVSGGTGGLLPTQAGTDVYRSLKSIIATYDEMVRGLPSSRYGTETLRIAVEFYDATSLNTEKLFHFDEVSQGRVSVDVKYCTSDDCYYRLMNNQADVAITNAPAMRRHEFTTYELSESDAVMMMGASNPLAEKSVLETRDLESQTVLGIVGCEWTSRSIEDAFTKHGVHPNMENVSFTTDALVALLLNGRGYHIAPELYARTFKDASDIVVRRLPFHVPPFKLSLVLYEKRPLKLYVDEFVEWFLKNADGIILDEIDTRVR